MTRRTVLRGVGLTVLIAFVLTMPYAMNWAGSSFALDYGVIIGMLVLSVSVLGWIGEISLAPVAQMGFGLVVVNLLQEAGLPFAVIMPAVIVSSIPISLLLGVFALRLRGVYFAIATLAFAFLAQKSVFQSYLGAEGGFEKPLVRPSYLRTDQQLYYLLMGSLLVVAALCYLTLRSRIGTRLTALRDSETAFAVLGHSPARYKLFTICLAGAIASLTGAYYGILQQVVPANYFSPALSIAFFAFAVVGGLGSIGGAVASGLVFGALPKYLDTLSEGRFVGYDQFFAGGIALLVILTVPGGLADVGRRLWRRLQGGNR